VPVIIGADTIRVMDVTERFFSFSWISDTFKLPADAGGKDNSDMKEKGKRDLLTGIGLLCAFILWTILIQFIDVQAACPNGTKIGLATFNIWFHQLTGVHMTLYTITDWLGLVPIFICLCFGALGIVQLIKRRCLLRVDTDLILLGVYYVLVIFCYLIFEMIPINYRPILIEGRIEASYPSSTTLLVLCVMPTLKFQVNRRSENALLRKASAIFVMVFSSFMVIGRLVSGVHWATDIAASILLSAGLFMAYRSAVLYTDGKRANQHLKE
jgi:undecaprenyl-diphosphatase